MATKSKEIIATIFLSILEDSPYDEITISEIIAHTPLVRKTFYNNFSDKNAIVEYICNGLMTRYITELTSSNEFSIYHFFNSFFEFGKNNKELFNLLIERRLFSVFKEIFITSQPLIISILPHNQFSLMNEVELNYVTAFHTSGVLAIFEIWITSNFDKTTEEITQLYMNLVKDIQKVKLN